MNDGCSNGDDTHITLGPILNAEVGAELWQRPEVYTVSKKKTMMFLVISSIKLRRFWWNLLDSFLNKFAENRMNVFHLTRVVSLNDLVKLKMLIAHV